MSANVDAAVHTEVYTTADGRVAIAQPKDAVVLLSAEQILTVIRELHVCYDYCAAWKATTPDDTDAGAQAHS